MKMGDFERHDIPTQVGSFTITAWAPDAAGNEGFISFKLDHDCGYASLDLEQTYILLKKLRAVVTKMVLLEKQQKMIRKAKT